MNELYPLRENKLGGIYYPKTSLKIIDLIDGFFSKIELNNKEIDLLNFVCQCISDKQIISFIVPHGSYQYSGYISSYVYYILNKIQRFDSFIIVSADHNGTSPGISIMNYGKWNTPLGSVSINENLASIFCADNLLKKLVSTDAFSLDIDNTIEPHLPFLQFIKGQKLKFLPILIRLQDKITILKFAEALARVLPKNESIVIIITSNLSHYFEYCDCCIKDKEIMSRILSMNVDSFYKLINYNQMNVCGYGCIALAMEFSKIIGNNDPILLKYQTSADVDRLKTSVVGYSSFVFL